MKCTHPERPNVLSLPSMGNPHCCRECWDAAGGLTAYKGKREAWDHSGYDHAVGAGDYLMYRTASGWRYENSSIDERDWK